MRFARFFGLGTLGSGALAALQGCSPGEVLLAILLLFGLGGDPQDGNGGTQLGPPTKVYWLMGESETPRIQRANLDGTEVETLLVDPETESPLDLEVDPAGGKMYWTAGLAGTAKVRRANLDGTGAQDLVATGLCRPISLALDPTAGKMYWADISVIAGASVICTGNEFQRANLDGTGVEDVLTGLGPGHLALDPNAGKVYWGEGGKIQRANLDGTNAEDVVDGAAVALALDLQANKVYWSEDTKIRRANLDGTGAEDVVTGLTSVGDLEVDPVGGRVYWTILGSGVAVGKVQRANLDGSDVEDVATGLDTPQGIALSPF